MRLCPIKYLQILDVHYTFKTQLILARKFKLIFYFYSIIDRQIVGHKVTHITDNKVAGQLPARPRPTQGVAGPVTGTVRGVATITARQIILQSSTTRWRAGAGRPRRARAGQRARRATKTDIAKWRCSLLDKTHF